jgi:ferredoxin
MIRRLKISALANALANIPQVPSCQRLTQRCLLSQSASNSAARKARGGRAFSGDVQDNTAETVSFTFIEAKTGDKINVKAKAGKTVLETAIDNNVDIEGITRVVGCLAVRLSDLCVGACGGELACSTCHVVISQELFDQLPAKSEEEQDMLDLAWGVMDTSRLCCQIKVSKLLEGQQFTVPSETNNMLP